MMLKNVTSALIAGGKSRRFGSSKLLARYKGKRLLDHALEIAQTISDDTMIIGNLGPEIAGKRIPIHKDIISGCGPLCGIYTALSFSEQQYVAVLPVDMPLLSADVYRFLYPSCTPQQPVVALSDKGLEPLVSIWPVALRDQFKQAVEQGEFKLYKLLEKFNARQIDLVSVMPAYNPTWFKNINYKEDLSSVNAGKTSVIPA